MPGPLLPLLASTLSRLVSANVTRAVAGTVSRAAAGRGAQAAASASPGRARSAFDYVLRYARQQSRRKAARARRSFVRNAPGFAQAHRWKNINKAYSQLNAARDLRLRGIQQSNPAMIDQANEQEERAKAKLAKETKALLESFTGLKRGVVGVVIALHSLPFAVQGIARSRVESFRATGMFSGRTAGALVRYDVNERLNRISSARFTSASDTRVIDATKTLNNEIKPLTDAIHVLYNEGLVVLIRATSGLVSVMRTFSPLVQAVEKLARKFADGDAASSDVTIDMMRGLIAEAKAQADRSRRDWDRHKTPPGGQP